MTRQRECIQLQNDFKFIKVSRLNLIRVKLFMVVYAIMENMSEELQGT